MSDETDFVGYPDDLVRAYRAQGVWGTRTIAQAFRAVADAHPDRPAVASAEAVLTYAELDRRADAIAVGLRDLGLAPGDRVLLQLGNGIVAVLTWYALLKAGAVPIATLPNHREHEIVAIAREAEPVAHIIQADFGSHDL